VCRAGGGVRHRYADSGKDYSLAERGNSSPKQIDRATAGNSTDASGADFPGARFCAADFCSTDIHSANHHGAN
jgi:uncharacterized protein YjbI with pentapeptide repeats